MKPITAIAQVTVIIGFGQRTTTVPILRQLRVDSSLFGSNRPHLDPITRIAGARVSAANTTTSRAIAHGNPMVWKYRTRVADAHSQAPAIGTPAPRTPRAAPP